MSDDAMRTTEMVMRLATPLFHGATQGVGGIATAGVIGTLGIAWMAGKAISAPFKGMASLVRYANEHPELLEKRGEITMKKLVAQETTGIHTTRLLDSKELEAIKAKLESYQVAFTVERTEKGAYIHLEAKDLPRLEHALEAAQTEIMRMEIKELDTHITELGETIEAEEKLVSEMDREIVDKTEELAGIEKDINELSNQEGISERSVDALRERQSELTDDIKGLQDERTERQECIEEMKTERESLNEQKTELENSLKEQQEKVVEPPTEREPELSETVSETKGIPERAEPSLREERVSGNDVQTYESVVSETMTASSDVPEPVQDITMDGNLTGQDVPTQYDPGTQKTTTTATRNNKGQQTKKRTETRQERAARKKEAAYKLDPTRAAAARQAPTPTTPNAKLSR
ncbi:MAG: hypothetical protein IKZ87_05705, partial [Actinomycetaceae bacterium]|nr:hypothetical protein [Actinomycetaceae bacterium]